MRLNNLQEGWSELPPINREKYQDRDGLEGPIQTKSGKVVYYDPKEGSYYDPDTDMYISYDDWRMLDQDNIHMIDMEEGRMSDQMIDDSETMTKDEFVKKYGREAAEQYFESSNPAMDRALRQIEKTFSPERQEISKKINVLAQAVEMMTKPQWKDRALDHASQVGVNSVEEIKQELMLLLRDEQQLDDEDITDVDTNIRKIEHTLEKLNSLNENSESDDTKYGIVRYPDTAISYIKNDGNGWEHIFDKSYGFEGPVDKEDLKYAKKITKEKIPSRMFEATDTCECGCDCGKDVCESCGKEHSVKESTEMMTEAQFDEAAGEKDACYRKVKSRYKVWPSAYASGALVKCRKVGAANWGNSKK